MVKRAEGENGETLARPMSQIKIRFSQRDREGVCVEKKKRKYWAKMKRKHVYEGRKKKKRRKKEEMKRRGERVGW